MSCANRLTLLHGQGKNVVRLVRDERCVATLAILLASLVLTIACLFTTLVYYAVDVRGFT